MDTPEPVALRALDLFADCTKSELREVNRLTTLLRLPAGRVLMSEGDIPKEFVVIGSGLVRITRTVDHRTETVSEIGAGGVVGEMELLDGSRRVATAVAATDLTVFVSTGSEFRSMLRRVPSVARKVRRMATTRSEGLVAAA